MNTALIVIDMQNGFLNPASPFYIAGAPGTVPVCQSVIDFCRTLSIPVFFITREYEEATVEKSRYETWKEKGRPLSPDCSPELSTAMPFEILPGDYHIVKPRYSAFFATNLDLILRRMNMEQIVLIGTTTPNCIRATAYDGISLDYDVMVLSDCTSSIAPAVQASNLEDMSRVGVKILSSAEFMRQT